MHFVFCQGGQKGTWRSQMAYLFPQERRCYLVGHLPSARQGKSFRESGSKCHRHLRVQLQVPPGLCFSVLLCCFQEFSARNSILGNTKKKWGVGREGWEKATRFIDDLCSDTSFCYFYLTKVRNHNPWMKRQWTNSMKSWTPRGCIFPPISGF